ncbi:MAG: hypothetical protein BM556_03315 [Bacteriovorax sp. MedPE-SWde]|nr:MAG: hypothetical protein BM556_03315 [Bacteriovorax sp. MedPE-SWde]
MKIKKNVTLLLTIVGALGLSSCQKDTSHTLSSDPNVGRSLLKSTLKSVNVSKIDPNIISKHYGGKSDAHFSGKTYKNTKLLCLADEQQFEVMQRQVIHQIEDAFRLGKTEILKNVFASGGKFFSFKNRINQVEEKNVDGVREYKWNSRKNNISLKDAEKDISAYLSDFTKIVDFDLSTFKFVSPKRFRNKEDLSMKRAKLVSRFDLRGLGKDGERRNDRGTWAIDVELQGDTWKVLNVDLVSGESLVKKNKATFKDVTDQMIGDQVPVYVRKEAIRRGGYALSITDFDNDGNHDIYVGTRENGVLLQGNSELTFREIKVGPENNRLVKTAIFGDFFNTGRQDLVLVRFVPEHLKTSKDEMGNDALSFSDVVFYENVGNGKYKKVEDLIENRKLSGNAMPAAVADFNGDQKLDFYIGFPGPLDFTFIGGTTGIEQGAQVQGLFINDGKRKKFVDRTKENVDFAENEFLFAHSSASVDLDMDGDMDLVVLDDRGNLSPVYLNDGTGKFTESAKKTGLVNSDLSMSLANGDVNNDGKLDFAITNVNFVASERWNKSCSTNWRTEYTNYAKDGLRLFNGLGDAKFAEVTSYAGLEWIGEGAGGVEFVDYNNDGKLDIYVVNGLWSGTDRKQDLSSVFVRSLQQEHHQLSFEMTEEGASSDFMTILNSFVGDILRPDVKVEKKTTPHMAGFQRNRLFRNDGKGKFTEVGFLEGIDSIADGYIVTMADLNKDGKVDLLLRNGDPGLKEVKYKPVQVFLNQNDTKRKGLIVTLEGTDSNRDGIGAFVTAHIGKDEHVRHLIGNNGTAQSEKMLHFGLDKNIKVDKLVVKWPSGNIQTVKNVPAGRIKIIEKSAAKEKVASE